MPRLVKLLYSAIDNIFSTSIEGIPQLLVAVQTLWSVEKSEVSVT